MIENNPAEVDLHIHTNAGDLRFPYMERLAYSPGEAVRQAKEVGLDALAITDHDTVKGLDEAFNAGVKHGIIVVGGIELTTRPVISLHSGIRIPHVLLLGLNPEELKNTRLPLYQNIETVSNWAHDHGAVAIGAHPFEKGMQTALTFDEIKKYRAQLDGVEVITPTFEIWEDPNLTHIANTLNLTPLGNSDSHVLERIGVVRTRILGQCKTSTDVVSAIKNKQAEPFVWTQIPEALRNNSKNGYFSQLLLGNQ